MAKSMAHKVETGQAISRESSFDRSKRQKQEQAVDDSYKKPAKEEEQFVPSKTGVGYVDKALWDAGVR